jgi:hypothetical protein
MNANEVSGAILTVLTKLAAADAKTTSNPRVQMLINRALAHMSHFPARGERGCIAAPSIRNTAGTGSAHASRLRQATKHPVTIVSQRNFGEIVSDGMKVERAHLNCFIKGYALRFFELYELSGMGSATGDDPPLPLVAAHCRQGRYFFSTAAKRKEPSSL